MKSAISFQGKIDKKFKKLFIKIHDIVAKFLRLSIDVIFLGKNSMQKTSNNVFDDTKMCGVGLVKNRQTNEYYTHPPVSPDIITASYDEKSGILLFCKTNFVRKRGKYGQQIMILHALLNAGGCDDKLYLKFMLIAEKFIADSTQQNDSKLRHNHFSSYLKAKTNNLIE